MKMKEKIITIIEGILLYTMWFSITALMLGGVVWIWKMILS